MTTTPVSKSKLACKETKRKQDLRKENDSSPTLQSVMNTPTSKNALTDGDDYSPIYFPLTQETNEEIDVLWDWHSPQTSQRKRRKQKRLIPVQSPKIPIKIYPLHNHSDNFERLRNELKALQEELALPDDESCLCVSPQQETEIKKGESNINLQPSQQHCELDDMFDDSMDEELVLFSQKIENEVLMENGGNEKTSNFSTTICDNSEVNNLINKYSMKEISHSSGSNLTKIFEETFNNHKRLNTPKHSKFSFQRTFSDNPNYKTENVIQTTSGKLEFHRTKSFELSNLNRTNSFTMEEIERKRLEAKSKLESKKTKEFTINELPMKCSPGEIEKKRLEALAKREAKKLQDIVEKNRLEALKKRQINRMKNASQVKSTLTTRL